MEAPLSTSSVEMMVFAMIHLMFNTNRVRETCNEHARKCLVSHTMETTSPACRRFSTSCLFREMPNSSSCVEFSERLQIVLFTLRYTVLNSVYHATADV